MGKEIYYTVEKIKKTPAGRVYCIKSTMGTNFEMLVSNEQYERFDIEEGEIIDDKRFLEIREEMLFDNARRAAFSILSCGENNKKSLIIKLQKKGFSYELCKNMADYMEHRGYIDEKKQIGLLCDGYLKKKYGKLKIINELVTKGYLREDVIEYVQSELKDVNFAENCAYIIENKFMPLPSVTSDEFKRMMGALMRYGYNIGDIKEAIKIISERGSNQ
ncbi:MAG: RecX family transcriptional regulator [Clostridia bacterium]|nr:RecX family transcriptional regulator [Clostridia bacterium]